MLVSDIVRRNASFFGDDDGVVIPDGPTYSWEQVDRRSNQLANALLGLGLRKGDRVATFLPNGAEYIEFFFACAKTGIIGSTTNVRLSAHDLTSYLSYVEPSAILVHAELREQAGWVPEVASIKHVLGVGADHGYEVDLADAVASASEAEPRADVDDDDVYQLGATSGTTGTPKGAILTHRNAIAAMLNWLAEMPVPEKGTSIQNIPLFFNPGGPAGLHPVLMKGGRTVIPPAFEPGNFLRSVPRYEVTHTILVPTMVGMVLNHPECRQHDLSSLQGIMSGGSPLHREVLVEAREVFGDVFFPLYGMAETYSNGTILRRQNQHTSGTPEQVKRLASVGKPNVLMQVRVVGDDGQDVPRDGETPGEIWMQGDTVSPGYFRLDEETAAAREDGWFKSGDIATLDTEGFITIVDRAKDIIITGGINVFSRDIEEVLFEHAAVAQAAVIGIPSEQWGEAIHAIVVLKPGQHAESQELIEFAAERLAGYKKPRSLDIVDSMPIGGTGKILKRELRAPFWAGRDTQV
jgi:long-chain acyl-CoA synthetase